MSGYADLDRRLPSNTERWQSLEFADELQNWVRDEVGPVRSLEQVKLRVWAAVWLVETDDRRFFAKQNCQLQSFEAALVALLAELVPDRVVPVAAVDHARGLLLTPDQGQVLGFTAADDDLDIWERVLVAGAELQREVAPHVERLSALGVTRLAATDAVEYTQRRIAEVTSLPAGHPMRLEDDGAPALRALLPTMEGWAEEVAALGLPLTLNHNDLHENNVFDVGGTLRFFDYADAVLAEPLAGLLIPLNMLAHRLETGPDDARLWRLADSALEVWSDLAPMTALRAALPAALQLARLGRVESWARCSVSMTDDERAEWGHTVPSWLAMLLEDPPLGRSRRWDG